jgi:putative endonuclease
MNTSDELIFTVYILYSKKYDKKYVGFTSNLIERFKSHNLLSKKGYSLKFRPWFVLYTEYYDSKTDATSREKWLKTGVGREFIKSNFKNWLEGSYPPRRT